MPDQKHPFDVVAEQLEALADAPAAGNEASRDYWELSAASDETVGDYPQALAVDPPNQGESEGLGPDGFPAAAGESWELELQPAALWTDVLSSSLWSAGYLLSDRALATFRGCDLGDHRTYATTVRDSAGEARPYTYLYLKNPVPPTAVDFGRSEFYIAGMLGQPGAPIAVDSFEDWQEQRRRARAGEIEGVKRFSTLDYKALRLRPGHAPAADLFTLEGMGIRVYITTRLRDAIVAAGLSGLEIRPNKRLFA